MKKYNRLIVMFIVLYLASAILTGVIFFYTEEERSRFYEVEINRIYQSLSGEESLSRLDLDWCKSVRKVTWIPADADSQMFQQFLEEKRNYGYTLKPWPSEGSVKGYFRFDYVRSDEGKQGLFISTEIVMAVFAVGMLLFMIYLKASLLKPFHRMSEIPAELAKGHLKGEVKTEKSRYFGDFQWGISQLKDSLDTAKRRRLELEKEKKHMILTLSHDIKTPLNTIRLYAKALEQDIYREQAQKEKAVKKIQEKAIEIETYIDEIRRTSREDILDIQVIQGEFYLAELMRRVTDVYCEKCMLRKQDFIVGKYENKLLNGDLDRAMEALENIMENALKYGDGRRIEISFGEEDYCQLIRVYNTGTPVTETEFNHIFESFFRGSNSKGQQGSGLGLYICREIMRRMDGEIFAETEQEGMAFTLVLR